MLKVFGHPMSTCTRKVLTAVNELGLPHEFVVVDFATGEHKQPAHLSRQPFGQVPAIDDDGFALYESRAICRYLNDKTSGALIPADLRGRAVMEQWISVESANFTSHAMKFVYEDIFKRPQGEDVLEKARAGLEKALMVMDTRLGKAPYFAGETFSIADIAYMPYVDYGMMTSAKPIYQKYPHVMAWWQRVSERPSWKKATGKA